MDDLKFKGEVIPVVHLLPVDVLVFTAPAHISQVEIDRIYQAIEECFPAPRKCVLMLEGLTVAVDRGGEPIPAQCADLGQ